MYMFKYVLKRIALMIGVFLAILTMCFVLVKLLPLTDAYTTSTLWPGTSTSPSSQ